MYGACHIERFREVFTSYKLVKNLDGTMYALSNCVWTSPFPLAGFAELSVVYPDLEVFFVERLRMKKADPAMLIAEIKSMAKHGLPEIDNIRRRLINVGNLVTKSGIDETVAKALQGLSKINFLPKRTSSGIKTLVGKDDDFAINDLQRFGDAFEAQHVLLDFSVEEVHVLNTIFHHLDLEERYLSQAAQEVSAVGNDAVEDHALTEDFRCRAYALYW